MKPSELLSSPEKWTKGALARDVNGKPVYESSNLATSFCILGALRRCNSPPIWFIDREKLEKHLGMPAHAWNDAPERTFEEVRDALIAIGE